MNGLSELKAADGGPAEHREHHEESDDTGHSHGPALASLALKQGGYDWGYLSYAVGFASGRQQNDGPDRGAEDREASSRAGDLTLAVMFAASAAIRMAATMKLPNRSIGSITMASNAR